LQFFTRGIVHHVPFELFSSRIDYRRFPGVERFFQSFLFRVERFDFLLGVEDDFAAFGADGAATVRARGFAHFLVFFVGSSSCVVTAARVR